MKYKYEGPHDWLSNAVHRHGEKEILSRLMNLVQKVDADTIQDEFQDLMEKDSYFEPIKE